MEAKGRREIDCERRKRAGERREKERRRGRPAQEKKKSTRVQTKNTSE